MKVITWLAAPAVIVALLGSTTARAGAGDYAFEAVTPEMKKGDDVVVSVRLVHKPSGKLVPDAVIFRTRIDMAPDDMADMVSPVEAVPSKEPGVYAFKTDLPMPGRYQVLLSAKVQGEKDTVQGKLIIKATK